MRILITGASSFLGGHVRREAAAAGHQVVTAGRSPVPASASHHRLDLAADGPAQIAALLARVAPDAVVNCAGATAGAPEVLAAANVTAVHALLTAMLETRGTARLVHIGSAAEYGQATEGTPVTELDPPRPASAYGATKLAGTALTELARTAGLDAVTLRVFNVVGAGAPQDGLPGRAAALLRQAIARGTSLRLGPLDAVRDFVDARDAAGSRARRGGRAGAAASGHQRRQRPRRHLPRPGRRAARGQRARRLRAGGRTRLAADRRPAVDAGRHHPGRPGPGLATVPGPDGVRRRTVGGQR